MQIEYESTLEDISEVHFRLFLLSKTYSKQRISESIWSSVIGMIVFYGATALIGKELPLWVYIFALIFGFIAIYITYADTVKRRLAKFTKRELGDKLPWKTTYIIEDDSLRCLGGESETAFKINSINSVIKEDEKVEIIFNNSKGVCLIPFRAFQSGEEMDCFLGILKREQDAAPN